jgi:hypothetical protein
MKKLVLLVLGFILLFSTAAEAGFGNSFWGGFWGSTIANSLYQPPPPSPTVVVVQPQQSAPQGMPSNATFIGKVVGIQGNTITVRDDRGRTANFFIYSSTKNYMGKPIEANDYVEISPTGSRFDMIEWINIVSPVAANSGGNGGTVDDVETRLKKAKSLWEQGLITEEEYKTAKQKILNDL